MSGESGTVNIHGKDYKTVALRVNEFRADHPLWTINTSIYSSDERLVVMRAEILDEEGRVISSGYAEENRTGSSINRTSALENCETSAVGRALAFFGLAGSEIASAEDMGARDYAEYTNKLRNAETIGMLSDMFGQFWIELDGDNAGRAVISEEKDKMKAKLS